MKGFLRDQRGAGAAEFALVLPTALLLLFGIIDVGRYVWQLNEYEKATQMGARYAVVTDLASAGLADEDLTYVGDNTCGSALVAGQTICAEALGEIICTSTACTCTGNCPDNADDLDADAFGNIVSRMQTFQPRIVAGDVRIEYRGSGIGFAGDPHKPEIAPFVTVRVANAQYDSITLSLVGGSIGLPDFSYTLTLEDGEGSAAS